MAIRPYSMYVWHLCDRAPASPRAQWGISGLTSAGPVAIPIVLWARVLSAKSLWEHCDRVLSLPGKCRRR